LLPGFWDTDLAKLPRLALHQVQRLMQFPTGTTAIRLATSARTFREGATKKPLTRGELRNAGTEVALDGGEVGAAVQRVVHNLYIVYIQDKREVKSKNTMRICSPSVPRLKDEWNHTVGSVNNLRCGIAGFDGQPFGVLLPGPQELYLSGGDTCQGAILSTTCNDH